MRALIVTMDGGGNLPPALGIAAELVRRGGVVRFLGNAAQRAAIEAAGFAFEPYREGRNYDASAPRSTIRGVRELSGLFADRGIGRDARALLAEVPADLVIVDCLLWGATLELAAADIPVVSLVHSQWEFFRANARGPLGLIARLRGTNPVAAEASAQLTLVVTRPEIELDAAAAEAAGARHTGFVWQRTPVETSPADRPRVLLSFSTTSFPGQAQALQNALDALAELPVDIVATTGAVDPAALRVPANARVERHLDHATILGSTSLVIGHGGHATTARALADGVPVLVLPMHPMMDQPAIGRAVERLGVGRSIAKSSSAATIRSAVAGMLADDALTARARELGARIREKDGAVTAVDALEAMLAGASASPRSS